MNHAQRQRFDEMVEAVIEALPPGLRRLLDEVPVIVLDRPSTQMLSDLGMTDDEADELCGLHSGTAFTERSVEQSGELPSDIHLFRSGIVEHAGGWETPDAADRIREEIEVTLLHEIGHQFGLDEDDLERLGYD